MWVLKKVNDLYGRLVSDLKVDFWTLDALWWFMLSREEAEEDREADTDSKAPLPYSIEPAESSESASLMPQRFALEKHLHEFLLDNWARTELGKDWEIYTEDGEFVGTEYPSTVGRIDLLTKHRNEPRWLVVELKRRQTSDETVGQVLRYLGWVKQNLAEPGDLVEGLIIAHSADEKIAYAISVVPNVRLMFYEVEFRLRFAAGIG